MKKIAICPLIIVVILSFLHFGQAKHSDFGMNKPHLLFHLGERKSLSVNYGLGYWMNDPSSQSKKYFTEARLWYQNTNNDLYVNMISHDGDSHIHQQINDYRYDIQANIRYQRLDSGWQQQYSLQKIQNKNSIYENNTGYWFTYMSVENYDPKMIDHNQYSSPVHFRVEKQGDHEIQLNIQRLNQNKETIKVKSQGSMKIFGLTMNISQSYDVRSLVSEVKHLIQIDRYNKKIKRKNDTKLVEWQNNQLKLIKDNEWSDKSYAFLVFYGQFTQNTKIFVTNGTKQSFQTQNFQKKSKQINQTLFPIQSYPQHSQFLRHILFNLYGGSAFYFGVLYTQNSLLKHEIDYSYTFTPSRLIFPRGFLWDDGFHLSVALHYNPQKCVDIIHNWFRKIDLFGWIGREQIRGFEVSSMMPQVKFVYQDIFQMNPPTLILPIIELLEQSKASTLSQETSQTFSNLLRQNFWKLEKWYRYFVKTQSHNNLIENAAINKSIKYRWRCKDDCQRGNFMGSGLDDYPRTSTQTQISKQHVDLMSWIYFFSEGLAKIAKHLGLSRSQRFYQQKKEEIRNKILSQSLDPEDLLFKDQASKAKNQYIDEHVTKIGYMNLFPFFTGVLRDQLYQGEQLEKIKTIRAKIVEILGDPQKLLSQDGVRSLSISDQEYGTLDNYWRGAVWMPINYMVLRACKKYYWDEKEIRQIYVKVRENLINTVKGNWQKTGYLFENYHEGKGNRGFPFYGWTSLILNVISQQY